MKIVSVNYCDLQMFKLLSYYDSKKNKNYYDEAYWIWKIKRAYAVKINGFLVQSLQYIFINHTSRLAKEITDKLIVYNRSNSKSIWRHWN